MNYFVDLQIVKYYDEGEKNITVIQKITIPEIQTNLSYHKDIIIPQDYFSDNLNRIYIEMVLKREYEGTVYDCDGGASKCIYYELVEDNKVKLSK